MADSCGRVGLAQKVRRHGLILLLLCLLIIVGVMVGNDYGLSWDEARNAQVGAAALRVYAGSGAYFDELAIDEHGPLYFMAFSSLGQWIHDLDPLWTVPDGRHLVNYFTFVLGVFLLYVLSLRVLPPRYAAMTAGLFLTQPLLFGQAFINQKDIPFMTFFLASVVTGLAAVDHLAGRANTEVRPPNSSVHGSVDGTSTTSLKADWGRQGILQRSTIIALGAGSLAIVLDLLFFGWIHRFSQSILYSAYQGQAFPPLQGLFSRIATDAYKTPLGLYDAKLSHLFVYVREFGVPVVIFAAGAALSTILPSLAGKWGFDGQVLKESRLIAAGLLLGATVCIRQVGAFALCLVAVYMLLKLRRRAIFPLFVCAGIAAVVTTLSWPYLWSDPLAQFIGSLGTAVNFPSHGQLFEGAILRSNQLPWTFFPTMASIELTEPAVVLICVGAVLACWRLARRRASAASLFLILGLWVLVPLFLLFFSRMTIYGNIRQMLFLMPPLFVMAGLAIEGVSSRLKWTLASYLLAGVAILPGIVGILQLHPYEYIYYNAFVGGVPGAVGRFELDRECLSFREGIEAINHRAMPFATVYVPIHDDQALPFARADLVLTDQTKDLAKADLVLSCTYQSDTRTRGVWERSGFRNVFQVQRQGAVLASVWERVPGQ